ncbi:hypothetical protein IRJ41_016433 [Triplophysa rosa]|uniref:Protein-lysine methyltransferase METTL21C n=1 Tax=Triplophysa rosa TaxID=992332 RepID=A0A9W8C901_TRIRA|nr:hypothetical protein IRJ41_016433 [Triplophysa rosa]
MDCEQCESVTVVTEETLKTKDNEKQDETEVIQCKTVWTPSVLSSIGKDIYYFAGHEINIWESLDSFGSIIWPAALALCRYLESNRETVDLHDKAVLEIGAGTGLVSIVSSLLGAWVTATDLPEVLGNLRSNLSRNTRGRSRYTPQAAELSWGCKLDKTFPHSVYKYDYVLAADVVYHHDFLAELLVTMRHFCQPGTTLIWANKVRFQSDLVFTENFRNTFNTSLLEDNGEVKIYSATVKEERGEVMEEGVKMENETGAEESKNIKELKWESNVVELQQRKLLTDAALVEEMKEVERKAELQDENQEDTEDDETERLEDVNKETFEMEEQPVEIGDEDAERNSESDSTENDKQQDYLRPWAPTIYYIPGKEIYHFLGQKIIIQESLDYFGATIWPAALALCNLLDTAEGQQQIHLCDKSVLELGAGTGLLSAVVTLLEVVFVLSSEPDETHQKFWAPTVYYKPGKEIYNFLGHEIRIQESIDSYGGMIWPAALALCRFLDTPAGRQQIDLLDKSTLELGAGTGLVSIVATLLGSKLAQTDLPEILGNLRCNLKQKHQVLPETRAEGFRVILGTRTGDVSALGSPLRLRFGSRHHLSP